MTVFERMTDARPDLAMHKAVRHARHGHICRAGAPFAALVIGARSYEVALERGEGPMLAFRAPEQEEWSALDRRLEDGWVAVAADILLLDPDVLYEFLRTHALRRDGDGAPGTMMEFDTLGVAWSVRFTGDRTGEVRVGAGPWHPSRLGLRAPAEPRARAVLMLLAGLPDARAHFEPHVSEWAMRIAKGVQVTPRI